MRFRFRNCWGLMLVVLLWGDVAAARSHRNDVGITVLVYDSARTSPPVLERAELEASRIFESAGIEIAWVNCHAGAVIDEEACRHSLDSGEFELHIVPNGKTSSDVVFGLAFLDEDGHGSYCDVFFDRIEDGHRESGANIPRLLGAVAAHELGHLLLGQHAHSFAGIMAPGWKEETLRSMNMGKLFFTPDQSSRMKVRIEGNNAKLARTAARAGE